MITDTLRKIPLFSDLSKEDLERVAEGVEAVKLPAGEILFNEGDPGQLAYVIQKGEVEVIKITDGREVLLAVRGAGEVIGEMALLDAAPRSATVRARSDTSLLSIPKAGIDNLLECSPGATRVLFEALLQRWQETESRLRQSQRMAQLGTLTAGLAHELNNPAAAINRAAGQLRDALDRYRAALAEAGLAGTEAIAEVRDRPTAPSLSPLERSDLEAELEEVLADMGVDRPWEVAADLAQAGVGREDVEAISSRHGAEAVGPVVSALAVTGQIDSLLTEISEGSSRLSAIVTALKSYSYLDRAPVQEVDVRTGIDDTLLILRHKLEGIQVTRDYAEDVPVIQAHAPELNQVWTNVVDNAADALAESGRENPHIVIRVEKEGDGVAVEIEDNGPGVPDHIKGRIFDPFFTTKPPGQGTGLGLDISYGIVVHRHRGEITVDSEPGRTVFRVTLPSGRRE